MENMNIKTRYDYEAQALNKPRVSFINQKSMTNQADMDSADINKIMGKYEKTGVLIDQLGIERKPTYGDFSEVPSYHESLSAIRRIEVAFNTQPAHIRNRFNNNPQELIEFLRDDKNMAEAIKLGIIADEKKVDAVPAPTPVTDGTPIGA